MKPFNLTLYTIGANSDRLLTLSKAYNINAIESGTIQTAVKQIDEVHTRESVVLLSPAAASFDQFNSYKHRGDTFMELVKNLKK
jgi:UDP-N-acetylmuramoylalanine--D-glutamate ligase